MNDNTEPVQPAVVGPDLFSDALRAQGIEARQVEWHPPPDAVSRALGRILSDDDVWNRIGEANAEALRRITGARCVLHDLRVAEDVVPGMEGRVLLHAGPPLAWERACGPMRGALAGACLYEGWARSLPEAEDLVARGEVNLIPCHERGAVGPMAGVISPSMPVFVVENEVSHNRAYSTLNEGLGKVLRYGANDGSVIARLRWLAEEVAPVLALAIRRSGGIDITSLIAQALHMGDELHNRNKAGTSLFVRAIAPHLVEGNGRNGSTVVGVLRYLAETDHFFLNLGMAASKAALDPAAGIECSTIVTAMCRNGTDFGIRCSGSGDTWFTAPAAIVEGLYFPGYGPDDANPDLGDSSITETSGLGGFALAAAPAITQFIGGTPEMAEQITHEMYSITAGEHSQYTIPALDFRGTPVGVDSLKVAQTRRAPLLDTGIAHREPGIGQIGAGIVRVPVEPFDAALIAMAEGL